ncbi:MAG: urease accessory protein UreE [Bauldia sp.]|nr:urease accessory protein UreE [Bauldia sp.]
MTAGEWKGEPADRVELDFDQRHRRRLLMETRGGMSFLLDLPTAVALRDGDGLVLNDGRLIGVVAADEALAEIVPPDAAAAVRIAWHLGNRHLPTEIAGTRLRIRRDHVIEAMAAGLGARVEPISAPFQPEGGAYAGGHSHGHDHEH